MKKDVVYIDIEDDITSIIDKLKASKEKIVALVPPKGNQVMQSVVNLKLLKRAAEQTGKQPVVVTSSKALSNLAGGLGMYTAKNLQSKPELADVSANEPIEDEAVEVSDSVQDVSENEVAIEPSDEGVNDEVELSEDDMQSLEDEEAVKPDEKLAASKESAKSSKKIPNFDKFKKYILIGLGILLLLFIVWFFTFGRPRANIAIRAETTPVDVAFDSSVSADLPQTDPAKYALKAQYQESKKSITQSFAATGKKDISERASGTATFSSDSLRALLNGITIPAGTALTTSGGLNFSTTAPVVLNIDNRGNGSAPVSAAEPGTKYNGASGGLRGAPSTVSASLRNPTAGGTDQVVTVIAQADVDKAKEQAAQQDSTAIKEELKKTFGPDARVLDDSFVASPNGFQSEPAVGEQANEGKLTVQMNYSILAVQNKDLNEAIKAFIVTKMTAKDQQQTYDDSIKNVKFERTGGDARNGTYKVSSQGQFGPKFDLEELKKKLVGKKSGEIRSTIESLPGVKGTDINLWPIWSTKAPEADRIQIKVNVDKNIGG